MTKRKETEKLCGIAEIGTTPYVIWDKVPTPPFRRINFSLAFNFP